MKKIAVILAILFSAMTFVSAVNGQINNSNSTGRNDDDKIYKQSEVDQKAKITKKPRASTQHRNELGECDGEGSAKVRAILRKSGEVSNIELIQPSPCLIFDENALRAAGKIKFKPALKDGQAVSVSVTLV